MSKKALILSFDLIRKKELEIPLAIASLLAYLKQDERYGIDFMVEHQSVNMWIMKNRVDVAYLEHVLSPYPLQNYDTIAISCYVWNEYVIHPLCQLLRSYGFRGKLVLGGYQISYGNEQQLPIDYPEGNIFISGYAEASLLEAILMDKPSKPVFLDMKVEMDNIPSAYLSGELPVKQGQSMLRWETKRGCPYNCTFCAHRDLTRKKLYQQQSDKVFAELEFFKSRAVGRVNVLDPIFNVGKDFMMHLMQIQELKMDTQFTLQTRLEMIRGDKGELFLDLVAEVNAHLEIGLQTIIEAEYEVVNRKNNVERVAAMIKELNTRGISYEVSLIYGLPNQTIDSFQRSLDFLHDLDCKEIKAFPLMLLKGTELFNQKEKYGLVEKVLGDFNIPTVVAGNSFSEDDWWQMQPMAECLMPVHRL